MEPWVGWLLAVVLGMVVIVLLFRHRFVSAQDKRDLMNFEIEMKLEGFRLHYDDLCRIDFEGAFAIHNSSKHIWYIEASPWVFHEAMKCIEGRQEPYEISEDVQRDDYFSVRFVKLRGTRYRDRYDLRRALEATYAAGKKKY